MKRIAWLTDIHLNFVKPELLAEFFHHLREYAPDVIMLGGDIAEATDVAYYLAMIDDELRRPVYFVLGNHDFYFGAIREVRDEVEQLCRDRPNLVYLTTTGVHRLTDGVGLVGHDGWADARIGDYERSMVMMNDYKLIREFAGVNKEDRWPLLKGMGDEAAACLGETLSAALERFAMVYVLTHVPPLREACWYDGRISDDEWAPHFTCRAVGDTLLDIVRDHPTRQVTVLCGHTHGSGECWPLKNLRILTGGAEYGFPAVNRLFTVR
jgi:predicted MPP superfamily phosphohydrolase